ncbi:MAG: class I SAM-dependent methyltransferase [Candidatus Mcinerneyibacterium aminivorans]|uniref:Class I SAM-dependent methyltransferase n=1 Tax=Candidatus Mcinerneyibacterium aminivorans TaxID=2703815 RepID=A0A5D0MLK6_9BACT|nr:MAG: class I SAM-dependent methyltransferase [Candidatus Mcinerneyibacterium aminivorans]
MSFYNYPELYDMFFTDKQHEKIKDFYRYVFEDKNIKTILDVSIGTANLTLPLAELGYEIAGTDLNKNMLEKAKEKFADKNIDIDLRICNFKNISSQFDKKFDCVISTGNSLPHVKNKNLKKVLKEMKNLIKKDGYIYFDLRNWDRILEKKKRFYILDPIIKENKRINYIQVWDYNDDGSIIFNIIIYHEKDNEIYDKKIFQEKYYPVKADFLVHNLEKLGFKNIKIINHIFPQIDDFEKMKWYCVIAQLS